MLDKIIKCIIVAAIESFPINKQKKAELLQRIMNNREGNDNVL